MIKLHVGIKKRAAATYRWCCVFVLGQLAFDLISSCSKGRWKLVSHFYCVVTHSRLDVFIIHGAGCCCWCRLVWLYIVLPTSTLRKTAYLVILHTRWNTYVVAPHLGECRGIHKMRVRQHPTKIFRGWQYPMVEVTKFGFVLDCGIWSSWRAVGHLSLVI